MLLSIAIPTYNRANYLDRCLDSITRQIVEIDYQVELLVVDNASTDHTFEIVEKYIKRGFQIKYSKGETNKGIDYNILQCYHLSKGKYVVAFGDDDILYDGVLKRLEKLLRDDFGIIYLENNNIPKNNFDAIYIDESIFKYKVYDSTFKTFNSINYYITYTSGCIINKNCFNIDFEYIGCFVALSPCIIKAITNANHNAIVHTKCIGFQPENSGGYKVVDVFAKNLNQVMEKEISDKRIISCINTHLLLGFFPIWMIRFKQNEKINSHFFSEDEKPYKKLKLIYKKRWLFWFTITPVMIMPVKIAKQYVLFLLMLKRLYSSVINLLF
jgi:glycosyltransferase involved in cell wall biosynthesis